MPSRKLTGHCTRCGSKNHLRAAFCNQCGAKLNSGSVSDTPQKLYADVAHPINSECREMIQNAVVAEFQAELQRAAQPDYRSRYDDEFDAGDYDEADYSDAGAISTAPDSTVPALDSRVPTTDDAAPAAMRPAEATETPATESSSDAVNDAFGAGLFEDVRPNADPTLISSNVQSEHDEAVVVRSEDGVRNSLPRPHFHDRPGPASRSLVHGNPPSQEGHVSTESERFNQTADDQGKSAEDDLSFGAGIFDD